MKLCKCGHAGRHGEGYCALCKRCKGYRAATGPMPLVIEDHHFGTTHYLGNHNGPMCRKPHSSVVPMVFLPSCRDCRLLAWSMSDEMYLDGVFVALRSFPVQGFRISTRGCSGQVAGAIRRVLTAL